VFLSAPVVPSVFGLHVAVHTAFGSKSPAEGAENTLPTRLVVFRTLAVVDVSSFHPDLAFVAEDADVSVATQILGRAVPLPALVTDVLKWNDARVKKYSQQYLPMSTAKIKKH